MDKKITKTDIPAKKSSAWKTANKIIELVRNNKDDVVNLSQAEVIIQDLIYVQIESLSVANRTLKTKLNHSYNIIDKLTSASDLGD